jgi:twinkle protein
MVLGLERNQQDEAQRNRTIVRILKNRFTGETGIASYLEYDNERGRLVDMGEAPVDLPEELQ